MKINKLPPIEVLREYLDYSPETGELRWKVKLNRKVVVGGIAGSPNEKGYIYIRMNGKRYAAHRIAWALFHGADPYPHLIDHKEGIENGNAINNLRLATNAENTLNCKKRRTNSSGHRGVRWQRGKWVARIKLNGKEMYLGRFLHFEDAIAARLKAEKENNIFVRD